MNTHAVYWISRAPFRVCQMTPTAMPADVAERYAQEIRDNGGDAEAVDLNANPPSVADWARNRGHRIARVGWPF